MASQTRRPSRAPADPSTPEEDLDTVWKRTIEKCQNITKWDLNDKTTLKVDDVVARIRPSKRDIEFGGTDQVKTVFKSTRTYCLGYDLRLRQLLIKNYRNQSHASKGSVRSPLKAPAW